ncbi:MAG: TlpA family protein disulfide reductase [Balneolaceae bacterium]|nr:TlpA family protein disulfide reductase [Balneolaceae bacterium]
MKAPHYIFTSLLIALALVFAGCGNDRDQASESSGDGSPESIIENAVFADLDGNEVRLEDYRGSLILIDFWESWCGPCLQVFPAMEDLRAEYPEEFQVFAVTVGMTETPEDARKFAEEHGYDFVWLYDENEIFNKLGGQGIPFKAYVDPDGNFIKLEMGSYGREGDYNRAKELINEYF